MHCPIVTFLSSPLPPLEHEKLWPNPVVISPSDDHQVHSNPNPTNTSTNTNTDPTPSTPTAPAAPTTTSPTKSTSSTSIFEAYYLYYYKLHIISNKKYHNKNIKKNKKNKLLIPSRDIHEGFDILRFIFHEIFQQQLFNKLILTNFHEKLNIYKREILFYKEEIIEQLLYNSCCELISQLFQESSSLLITKNQLLLYRHMISYIFGLFGIIYECCQITLENNNYIPTTTPTDTSGTSTSSHIHPGTSGATNNTSPHPSSSSSKRHPRTSIPIEYHELIEKISLLTFPKILGGYPKNDYLNLGHLPQPNSNSTNGKNSQSKVKLLKKKNNKKKELILTLTDPLYGYEIVQMMNISLSDYQIPLKSYSLDHTIEQLYQWVRDLMNKRIHCKVDKSWNVCSKITNPENIYPMTSEDRHILCGYQVLYCTTSIPLILDHSILSCLVFTISPLPFLNYSRIFSLISVKLTYNLSLVLMRIHQYNIASFILL